MISVLASCLISLSLLGTSYSVQPVEIAQEVPIVMYHEIGTPDGPWESLYVLEENFREQMRYLKENNYHTITIDELLLNRKGLINLPPNPIVITFDDGYSSMYHLVFELFKENNMRGIFYLYPQKFGTWNSLTKEQATEMSDNGMVIGSHSMSHLNMHTMTKSQITYELEESKKLLEEITGKKIISFCYPAGRYSSQVIEELKNAGYQNAVTTKYGHYSVEDSIYEIKRIRINYSDSLNVFIKRIN